MEYPALSPRLATIAGMVTAGRRVADIGTDHALLPAYLVGTGKAPSAIAADIVPGPLAAAAEQVQKYHLSDRITLIQCDGLAKIPPEKAEEIIIAGMGGELIARILGEWPYSREQGRRFLLQPMTKSEVLRQFLSEEGFRIEEEQAVCEGERVYTVLAVRFVGRDTISPEEKTPCYYHFGKHPGSAARASALWIERERLRLLRRRDGLVASGKEPDPVLLSLIAAADAALAGFQEE